MEKAGEDFRIFLRSDLTGLLREGKTPGEKTLHIACVAGGQGMGGLGRRKFDHGVHQQAAGRGVFRVLPDPVSEEILEHFLHRCRIGQMLPQTIRGGFQVTLERGQKQGLLVTIGIVQALAADPERGGQIGKRSGLEPTRPEHLKRPVEHLRFIEFLRPSHRLNKERAFQKAMEKCPPPSFLDGMIAANSLPVMKLSFPVSSRTFLKAAFFTAILLGAGLGRARAAEPALKLKDHDVWVMVGDSITAQRMHTNYIEAFFRTRHPELNLHFRNSGIGGNRTKNVLDRFDYDVAAWKPTIVSVELGMNDVNGPETALQGYIEGMKEIIARIRAIPAQPVLISSSPVDDGSRMGDWKGVRCGKLHPFTEALQKLAAEEKVLFIDQYHPLIDVWGENRRKGAELAAKNPQPAPVPPAAAAPAKPAPPKIPPSLIPLGGDPVHPGPVGQYTMAAAILKGLKADGDVSSATLTADGKVSGAIRCKITDVVAKDGKLAFTRLDETGPWPILPSGKAAMDLMPDTLELSRYLLRVTGLPEGDYKVLVNGKPAATVAAKNLAGGWNMTLALGERSTAIGKLIGQLQGPLNNEWRKAGKEKDAAKLASAQAAIETCEKELQALVQPVPLQIEISR